MSLIDFIEKLQKKPKYVRTQIMWLCVSVCMVFVVGIWFITFKNSISNSGNIVENQEQLELLKKTGIEAFSIKESLKTNIKSFFENSDNAEIEQELEKDIEQEQKLNIDSKIIEPANLPLIQE
ncbi:hypothetical protein ACFLZ0_00975 [Patescibacteria group bacterium]